MATDTYENLKLYWVPTVASLAAPTVANITAGTAMTDYIPVAGVNLGGNQNTASLAMLGDAFISEDVGTHSKSLEITFVRHKVLADDDMWALFTYKLAGHVVIGRFGSANVAGNRVEVYQASCGEKIMETSTENEKQRFRVMFAIQDYNLDAIVAA